MLYLYQHGFGHQGHYVVAESFGHAERLILSKYPHKCIQRIDYLGPYVILPNEEEPERELLEGE